MEPKRFNDLEQWLDQHRSVEIECLVPDLTGVARGKILPRSKFSVERGMRLPESILGLTVTGNWPADARLQTLIAASDRDLHLLPDAATVRVVPWATEPAAQVIHDCHDRDGQPIDYAPRQVLKRVLGLYAAQGWRPVVAPELEFYLVERNTDPDLPLRPPLGRSGRAETARQHYSIDAVNDFDPLFEDIYDWCAAMELDVDTLIHEAGAGQLEINFLHGDALDLADQVFVFKRALREAALRHRMYATFMAKPLAGEPGSAMHVHQNVVARDSGRNLFSAEDGGESAAFRHYIGGLQRHVPQALALFAPYVNSYRRLAAGGGGPLDVGWGRDDRSVGIRVPDADGAHRRVENRVIGADANPYVALAATLACGYLGLTQRIDALPAAGDADRDGARAAPLSLDLGEALRQLDGATALEQVLGARFCQLYQCVKRCELEEFMQVISPWEREHLLLHV